MRGSVDVCILSLAMWGSNCHSYVSEAHRILDSGGRLLVVDSTKRWSTTSKKVGEEGWIAPGMEGIKMSALLEEAGFAVLRKNAECKFCVFVCVKE